jgi:hypothetical protein
VTRPTPPASAPAAEKRAGRSERWLRFATAAAAILSPAAAIAADLTFQADNWTAECAIGEAAKADAGDCSVTGVFQDIHVGSAAGSFALLVAFRPPAVAIVGRPFPQRAELRIDANQPFICTGTRYCVFAGDDTKTIVEQLNRGSLILVDIASAKNLYRASLSAKGYRASLAKIRAEEE